MNRAGFASLGAFLVFALAMFALMATHAWNTKNTPKDNTAEIHERLAELDAEWKEQDQIVSDKDMELSALRFSADPEFWNQLCREYDAERRKLNAISAELDQLWRELE